MGTGGSVLPWTEVELDPGLQYPLHPHSHPVLHPSVTPRSLCLASTEGSKWGNRTVEARNCEQHGRKQQLPAMGLKPGGLTLEQSAFPSFGRRVSFWSFPYEASSLISSHLIQASEMSPASREPSILGHLCQRICGMGTPNLPH